MHEFNVPDVWFIAQQDGEIEQNFVARVTSSINLAEYEVSSAYLCRVHYGDPSDESIALCLAVENHNPRKLMDAISAIFKEMFGAREHLDIIPLTMKQQEQIQYVCDSFYPMV